MAPKERARAAAGDEHGARGAPPRRANVVRARQARAPRNARRAVGRPARLRQWQARVAGDGGSGGGNVKALALSVRRRKHANDKRPSEPVCSLARLEEKKAQLVVRGLVDAGGWQQRGRRGRGRARAHQCVDSVTQRRGAQRTRGEQSTETRAEVG